MAWMIAGQIRSRETLRSAILLGVVLLLIFNSVLWAGPMGDPEPGQSSPAIPQGTSPESIAGNDIYSSVSCYIELALLLAGLQL